MSLEEEKKKQTKKVNDFRLWKQSHNLKNENIIVKANGNQSTIKQYSNDLNEEENTKNTKSQRTVRIFQNKTNTMTQVAISLRQCRKSSMMSLKR